ncbi:MAG: cell envelope integrity protein CreD [Fibrobacteres bacterium]|nr:cell envelope integrity protein CreD [Fibrobacterota bacterium]
MVDLFQRLGGFLRLGFLAVLLLLLLIPVQMVRSLVSERQSRAESANREVASKWGEEQFVGAFRLDIPMERQITDSKGNVTVERRIVHAWPDSLGVDADLAPSWKYRGMHRIPVWKADQKFSGHWTVPDFDKLGLGGFSPQWSKARVQASLGLPRNLEGFSMTLAGLPATLTAQSDPIQQNLVPTQPSTSPSQEWQPSSAGKSLPLQAVLPPQAAQTTGARIDFAVQSSVRGNDAYNVFPLARATTIQVRSGWKDPRFWGAFLPSESRLGTDGFSSRWDVSSINLSAPMAFASAGERSQNLEVPFAAVHIRQQVDAYDSTDRAVKYAILFIGLMFAAFFLLETSLASPMHPIQYALVGLECVMFYLLTLSFSEHFGFDLAYLAASILTTGAVVAYMRSVLDSWLRSLALGVGMALLHGFVWTLLKAEDLSLVLGSSGLFAILAVLLWFTRRLRWTSPVPKPQMEDGIG